MRRAFLLLILLCSLISIKGAESRAEFYGTLPTGLLELKRNHPYYLFVPPDYSPEKAWPLLVLYGEPEKNLKEIISPWVDWAKQNHFLVLVPSVYPREGTLPFLVDQWLFEIKKEVAERYRVDHSKVLLLGFGFGAHYAAYLGIKYPEEFTAAALVRKAWAGSYEQLMKPVSNREKQIPFYVALDPKGEEFTRVEKKALDLERKGYHVTLETLKTEEDFSKLRDQMLSWFREQSEARAAASERPKKTGKYKIREQTRKFFEV